MSSDRSQENPDLTDAQLLAAMAQKKQWALAKLYDRYAGVLYRLALKILENQELAEDVLHDAFLIAWHKAALYNEQRGNVSAWLVVLCRNLAIDRYRVKMNLASRRLEMENTDELLLQGGGDPESDALASEEGRLIRLALEKLPREQKEVIELAYYRGMSQQEIAQATNTPLGTVKTRTRQAMKKLRESLRMTHSDSAHA
jgi:RNA polymerase sigma-70 factor (ECF subfamily)